MSVGQPVSHLATLLHPPQLSLFSFTFRLRCGAWVKPGNEEAPKPPPRAFSEAPRSDPYFPGGAPGASRELLEMAGRPAAGKPAHPQACNLQAQACRELIRTPGEQGPDFPLTVHHCEGRQTTPAVHFSGACHSQEAGRPWEEEKVPRASLLAGSLPPGQQVFPSLHLHPDSGPSSSIGLGPRPRLPRELGEATSLPRFGFPHLESRGWLCPSKASPRSTGCMQPRRQTCHPSGDWEGVTHCSGG